MSTNGVITDRKAMYAELRGQYGQTGIFTVATDPIRKEVRAVEENKYFMFNYPIVPFLDGGELTLHVLSKISRISPTYGACINALRHFVMGGQFEVIKKKRQGFARINEREVSPEEFNRVADWVTEITDPKALYNEMDLGYLNWLKYGNAYTEIVLGREGSVPYMKVFNHDADRCLYLATEEQSDKVLLVSPYWYETADYGHQPTALPVYPVFAEFDDGTRRTVIHTRHEVDLMEWYGLPYHIANMYFGYNEGQVGQYNVEGYDNNFTGQVFFETFEGAGGHEFRRDDYPEAQNEDLDYSGRLGNEYQMGSRGFLQKLIATFSNRGRKLGILHRNAASDAQPTKVHEFKRMTDNKYLETTVRVVEAQILKSFGLDPALLGVAVPGQLGLNQQFTDSFKVRYHTLIKPHQDMIADLTNLILMIGAEWTQSGADLIDNYSLHLKNLYKDMMEAGKEEQTPVDTTKGGGTEERFNVNPEEDEPQEDINNT